MKNRVKCVPTIVRLLAVAVIASPAPVLAAEKSLELTLPREFYAVVGEKMTVDYGNLVLTETPDEYRFDVSCDVGEAGKSRWSVTPAAADVGSHALRVTVTDSEGVKLASAKTMLRVAAADAGAGRSVKLLIVGDSLTHATTYPNEIARLLSRPGNPAWKMLGTHKPKSAAEGVAHEGYGGWTWQRFAAHYEPNPDGTYRKRSSPFVFLGDDGKPKLDAARYFEQEFDGARPDYVIFLLGINDCFSADPENPAPRIESMLKQAERLLKEFRRAAPQAELGVCLTTPPNSRDEAFQANYKGRYPRWGWKRIQHQLVQAQIEHFDRREDEQIFLVPTELNLDPTAGYPANNGVHPNAAGYRQIGGSIYAWLKHRLAAADRGLDRSGQSPGRRQGRRD